MASNLSGNDSTSSAGDADAPAALASLSEQAPSLSWMAYSVPDSVDVALTLPTPAASNESSGASNGTRLEAVVATLNVSACAVLFAEKEAIVANESVCDCQN